MDYPLASLLFVVGDGDERKKFDSNWLGILKFIFLG